MKRDWKAGSVTANKTKLVFTCPETEDLTGICNLCEKGIEDHDSEYRCQDNISYGE